MSRDEGKPAHPFTPNSFPCGEQHPSETQAYLARRTDLPWSPMTEQWARPYPHGTHSGEELCKLFGEKGVPPLGLPFRFGYCQFCNEPIRFVTSLGGSWWIHDGTNSPLCLFSLLRFAIRRELGKGHSVRSDDVEYDLRTVGKVKR